jgi:hypothetical protein
LHLDHFDVSLTLITKGEGCHVILNTVSGPDVCRTVSCLARHGHCIQLVQADVTRNTSMGKIKSERQYELKY